MPVALRIVTGGGGDAVAVQALGDGTDTCTLDVLAEDALHDLGSALVDFQASDTLTVRRLRRVGVRPGVGELVAVGRSATEEPAPLLRLRAVSLAAGIDPAADLGHPQLDVVVREERERKAELAPVDPDGGSEYASVCGRYLVQAAVGLKLSGPSSVCGGT